MRTRKRWNGLRYTTPLITVAAITAGLLAAGPDSPLGYLLYFPIVAVSGIRSGRDIGVLAAAVATLGYGASQWWYAPAEISVSTLVFVGVNFFAVAILSGALADGERALRLAAQDRRVTEQAALRRLADALLEAPDLPSTLDTVLAIGGATFPADGALLVLVQGETIGPQAGWGVLANERVGETVSLEQATFLSTALARNRPTWINDFPSDPRERTSEPEARHQLRAGLAVPLVRVGQAAGVLAMYRRSVRPFSEEDAHLLALVASQTQVAIERRRAEQDLYRSNSELAQAYDSTLEGWSKALDLRDRQTEHHTLRVVELTLRLAQAMGLESDQLVHVRRGALLHDIGKMGIPDAVLLKPGPLSDEESAIMRRHPTYAYEMLSPIAHLRQALDIPYSHHEKWDGSGYPRGLQGEDIPLAARIFAVADVWDALRSDRPYRAAWPESQAREYIRSLAGSHLDKDVVDVFLEMPSV